MSAKAEFYFDKEQRWHDEIAELRSLVLTARLEEDLKWGCPCYTLGGSNVVLIHVFKEYCALLFFKGALMADPEGILVQQTKNVQVPRQLRFTSLGDIDAKRSLIRAYLEEAKRVETSGLKAERTARAPLELADEFKAMLDADADLKAAFEALSPGRQRGYSLFFSAAKQSPTRTSRIEKCVPRILDGKGLDD